MADKDRTTNSCRCQDWQANISVIQACFHGTPFNYCPWCGTRIGTGQRDPELLAKYRQRVVQGFLSEDSWGMPVNPNMLVASQPIEDYRRQTGDTLGELDLMLTFVESGTEFTNRYGDIDEPFYEGLELMLDRFRDLLLENPSLYEEGDLAQRLIKLARTAGDIGWGYGDYVTDQIDEIRQRFKDL